MLQGNPALEICVCTFRVARGMGVGWGESAMDFYGNQLAQPSKNTIVQSTQFAGLSRTQSNLCTRQSVFAEDKCKFQEKLLLKHAF